jgi:hypothetical protein
MKAILVLCFAIAVCFGADQSVKPTGIPASAVQTQPGFYRYTDAAGTTWLLRQTPFGVAAVEEKSSELVKATDMGDSIRFDQTTLFGVHTWQKKKTDLTQPEREVWDRQHSRDAK